MRYGGIEAGGTRWVCAVVDGQGSILDREIVPTTTPAETIGRSLEFLSKRGPLRGVGIGAFGPIDLRPGSPTFGQITTTPKAGWANTDIDSPFRNQLGVEVSLDTDVNVAALGEQRWGRGAGLRNFVYLTVGTGIGGGVVLDGRLLRGTLHPEVGHVPVPHQLDVDPFPGCCPYHQDCLEGLASGQALRQRWRLPAEELVEPEVWELEARYLAYGLANLVYTVVPQRIILGGGVARQPRLLPLVRTRLAELIAGYVDLAALSGAGSLEDFVVAPGLGEDSGVLGAAELARSLLDGYATT